MAEILKKGDEIGRVLVQVQDDLKQLKRSLHRVTLQDGGETLDTRALETAIHRTECGIQRHTEEYLKSVNKHILTLPCIENVETKTVQIPQWRPPLESLPGRRHEKSQNVGPSPGQKHKTAFMLRLVSNPVHPKIRDVMSQSYGVQFPELPKRTATTRPMKKAVTGRTVGALAIVPGGGRGNLFLAPPLSEEDMRAGLASLLERPCDLDLAETPVLPKAVQLHLREDASFPRTVSIGSSERVCKLRKDVTLHKDIPEAHAQMAVTPPTSTASKKSDKRLEARRGTRLISLTSSATSKSKFPLVIMEGQADVSAPDFCRFHQHYCLSGGELRDALRRLEHVLRCFAVPVALVSGERLVGLVQSGALEVRGHGGGVGGLGKHGSRLSALESRLLLTLENHEEVSEVVERPGRRYRGVGGREAAAVRIQACWRRHRDRSAYVEQRRRRWAEGTIAIAWLMHAQLGRVRRALQARRLRSLQNCRQRAKYLADNWKHISTSRRTIIHIPSLGYTQEQRFSLWGLFDIMQNSQMGRLCDVLDDNVDVIYLAPKPVGEDLSQYYTRLLALKNAVQLGDPDAPKHPCVKRITILTPEAWQHFPTHNMCLSTVLWHSPRTLKRIRNLIQGRRAYIVGGVPHPDDLLVAEELGVPVLGPEPAVAQLYGTKSGGRRVFTAAGVPVPPGQRDIYTLQQLHETLTHLITNHMDVQRWLFKIDSELGGRGTAYCDMCHLGSLAWAQQQQARHQPQLWNTEWAKEEVLVRFLEEVPQLLAQHARPSNRTIYSTWEQFLAHFLRYGGVVEAYPPSESVTCLTVDLLVEPAGEVRVLCCGDQFHGPSGLEVLGSSVPQTSICPEALHRLCDRVGRACLDRGILGYLALDLVTFLHPSTMEQQVWAIDLDLGYSNQLVLTQLTLALSGATLDCRTSRLEVSLPIKEKNATLSLKEAKAQPTPVTSRYAVIGSRLLHTNLSMVHYSVFFQMCKAQGIGFDIKERQGTLFALHDSTDRYSLGMVTLCEDLQGSLMTFARNLSVIHQEISAPNMQGVSNFKDMIKDIEAVLGLTIQNKTQEKTGQTDGLTSTDQD
ncbi:IQ motif-containing protein H [Clupea harengus]|uniref:IQ motif-containing protein H n=1 Tax=Clupea harengus TaxID=7950 RepID=A0A6P8FA36_CLUHA|nr:IQ motif-containing protein H [Clupea harengus]XP_031420661.1 IQ motif-containing protein H [Clupea harengus]